MSSFELKNLERIEVLKGPQGTLFGRNSTGGVINVITRDPSKESAVSASVSYGRFDAVQGDVYLTTGVAPDLALDLSFSGKTSDGFGTNIATGNRYGYEDSVLVRPKLLWTSGDSTRIPLSGFYSNSKQSHQRAAFPGFASRSNFELVFRLDSDDISFYDGTASADNFSKFEIAGATLRIEQELQLANKQGSAFDWIVGAYYYRNKTGYDDLTFIGAAFGPGLRADSKQVSKSISGFARATVEVLPKLKLTGGVRYTHDKLEGEGVFQLLNGLDLGVPPPDEDTIGKFTFKGAAGYQFTDDVLGYASFSRGFKSGNYGLLTYNRAGQPDAARLEADLQRRRGLYGGDGGGRRHADRRLVSQQRLLLRAGQPDPAIRLRPRQRAAPLEARRELRGARVRAQPAGREDHRGGRELPGAGRLLLCPLAAAHLGVALDLDF